MKTRTPLISTLLALLSFTFLFNGTAMAHCDTVDGPVVESARLALDNQDITPVLKWILPHKEDEISTAFEKTLAVRAKGAELKEFADNYFFETLVRIHREGEGAAYSGLKQAGTVDPAVAIADKSLAEGNIDNLVNILTGAMAKGIHERFDHVSKKMKEADKSVEAGREFVASYVDFTHYVEGIHGLIKGKNAHNGTGGH